MTSVKRDPTFKELLEFPCKFSFRVIGNDSDHVQNQIVKVIEEEFELEILSEITRTLSQKGTYASFHVELMASSEEQLKALYAALGKIESVKYVL